MAASILWNSEDFFGTRARFCRMSRISLAVAAVVAAASLSASEADWSCGFEAAEGFTAETPAAGSLLSVVGGTAIVTAGGAAEGQQFVRFTPLVKENALILKFGVPSTKGLGRRIDFALRLPGEAEKTRLVLSYGQTLAFRITPGGAEVEVAGDSPRRLATVADAAGWLRLAIAERPQQRVWDLYIGGRIAAQGLPMEFNTELFSDLLVFSDGALDLDAIQVSIDKVVATLEAQHAPDGPATAVALTPEQQGPRLAQALESARRDDFSNAVAVASSLVETQGRKVSVSNLDLAQKLGMLAFALHDEGRFRAAAVLAGQALKYVDVARGQATTDNEIARLAGCEFVSGQITEEILSDYKEAERYYRKAFDLNARHSSAKQAIDRIVEKQKGIRDPSAGNGGGR